MEKPPIPPNSAALEQFILLSKTAKGAGAAELVKQALEAPGVYVFGELLDMPNVKELANSPHSNIFNLLNVFAYGTFSEYKAKSDLLPALTVGQLYKLRHLSVISLATKNKCLPYSMLLNELDITNLRELEDLIIDAIYADIIRGKLDQKRQQLEVDFAIGRDIRPEHFQEIELVLQQWCSGCEELLQNVEMQASKSNERRESELKVKQQIEQEVANIKKNMKTNQPQDGEERMLVDSQMSNTASGLEKPIRKLPRTKGGPNVPFRGSPGSKPPK